MPASPSHAENLADETRRVYEQAELRLLALIGRYLAKDMDAPNWAELKLLQLQLLQGQADQIMRHVTSEAAIKMAAAVTKAANRGTALAMSDVEQLLEGAFAGQPLKPPGVPAVQRILSQLLPLGGRQIHQQVLRWTMDTYQEVVADTTMQVLLGVMTRKQAAEASFQQFARKGVAGFVDRAGRNWVLESYTEMAVRTAAAKATTQSYAEGLQRAGQDLVMISNAPQECKRCRPWEGQILSLSGATRVDGVEAKATLAIAEADGLFHPNCRHSMSLYQPGVTKRPTQTADPEGDKARQKLRYLERKVREERRAQIASLDDDAGFEYAETGKLPPANARIRELQAKIRDHVANTTAKRQPHRERLGAL